LSDLLDGEERCDVMSNDLDLVRDYISNNAGAVA
jgi:hypothetical protein